MEELIEESAISNWLAAIGGGWNTWAIDVDHFEVAGTKVFMNGMTAAIDPAYNVIVAPYAVVAEIYRNVPGAAQDDLYPSRWVSARALLAAVAVSR